MTPTFSEIELSAIQELGNIGTGNAATALAQMIGLSTDIAPPRVEFVSLAEAASYLGPLENPVFAVLTPVIGDVPASILLVFPGQASETLSTLLGCEPGSDLARSALQEIGNILTATYATAIASMTGLALEPGVPVGTSDLLGSVVHSVVASAATSSDTVLFLHTDLSVDATSCEFGFVFVPEEGSVEKLLAPFGLGGGA